MEMRVPSDKLARASKELEWWANRKQASIHQIRSILGLLLHIASVVQPGRRFVSRLIELIKSGKRCRIELDESFQMDIKWWTQFISEYNGISLIQDLHYSEADTVLTTDSTLTGLGAYTSKGYYLHDQYPSSITSQDLSINCLELLAIISR